MREFLKTDDWASCPAESNSLTFLISLIRTIFVGPFSSDVKCTSADEQYCGMFLLLLSSCFLVEPQGGATRSSHAQFFDCWPHLGASDRKTSRTNR